MPLFLFTGEEDLLLGQELSKRKAGFIEKYGAYGLFDFASDNLNSEEIQNALMSGGMFSTKKLVIIRGIPGENTAHNKAKQSDIDRIIPLLEQFVKLNDTETIVVCISYKPDKRLKAYKWFQTNAQLKEFPRRNEKQTAARISQELGTFLTPKQQVRLTQACGDSYGHLFQESLKLHFTPEWEKKTPLSDEQLESIVRSNGTNNNFDMLDALFTDQKKTLQLITKAQRAGEDMFQFLGMMYRSLKITINMINLYEHGITESKQVASTLKIHPFVVSKQIKLIPQLIQKKSKIKNLYTVLLHTDEQIKTGTLPAEGFWLRLKQSIILL